MDPISAIGFASSVLTFIEFSTTLVRATYKLYQSGTTADNAHISNVLEDLQQATKELSSRDRLDIKDQHQRALASLSEKCLQLSEQLAAILDNLQVKGKSRKWKSVKSAWMNIIKQSTITSMEKRLAEYRSEIMLRLNLMTSIQNSSLKAQLDEIEENGARLGKALAGQSTELLGNLQQVLQLIQYDNASLSAKKIRQIILQWQESTTAIDVQNTILEALYFKSMFIREEAIDNPEAGTFEWLLDRKSVTPYSTSTHPSTSSFRTANSILSDATTNKSQLELEEFHGHDGNQSRRLPSNNHDMLQDVTLASNSVDPALTDNLHSPDSLEYTARSQISSSFKSFLQDQNGYFFVSGKAGSGKSTLMKYLSYDSIMENELILWANTRDLIFARFFFWNSGDELQMSLAGFYRSLLFEILKQCPDLIQVVFPTLWADKPTNHMAIRMSLPFLKSAIQRLMDNHAPSHALCLMVDGLDEYQGDALEHFELARLLKKWSQLANVKIICSARPHTEFVDTFDRTGRVLHLHELTRSDIRHYAGVQFASRLSMLTDIKSLTLLDSVIQNIVEMADGVFLWARLVVRSLLIGAVHEDSSTALLERLHNTPKDINKLFQKILDSVDSTISRRSEAMLSFALNDPFHHSSIFVSRQALAYSWLEDLADPQFPFNRPCKGLSEEEIQRRLKLVRHQLDVLTRGLLEIKKHETGRFARSRQKEHDYWRYRVGFMHRSVKEFLANHWDGNRDLVSFEDHLRLGLAEAQFGTAKHLLIQSTINFEVHEIYEGFEYALSGLKNLELHHVIDQLGLIMSSYTDLSFSFPEEVRPWFWRYSHRYSYRPQMYYATGRNLDFLEWATSAGLIAYVEGALLKSDSESLTHNRLMHILMACIRHRESALVRLIFERGVSPNVLCTVSMPHDPTLEKDAIQWARPVEVSAWILLLRIHFTHSSLRQKFRKAPMDTGMLKEYIKAGADTDVIILGFILDEDRHGRHDNFVQYSEDFPHRDELFYMELHQLLGIFAAYSDPEMVSLVPCKGVSHGWSQFGDVLAKFGLPSKKTSFRDPYRPATMQELKNPNMRIYGVISKNSRLVGNFSYTPEGVDPDCLRALQTPAQQHY